MKIRLVIPLKVESANKVLNWHFGKKAKSRKQWDEWVELAIRSQLSKEEKQYFTDRLGEPNIKYKLTFTARLNRRIDQSNLFIKFAEDGLKKRLITDDSRKYIEELTIKQELLPKGKYPETIIEVELIER
jgi:hypothetical protein